MYLLIVLLFSVLRVSLSKTKANSSTSPVMLKHEEILHHKAFRLVVVVVAVFENYGIEINGNDSVKLVSNYQSYGILLTSC